MLAPGGTLVSYGTASTKDEPGDPRVPVLKLIARLTLWNLLPNGRSTTFFNLWAGKRNAERYWAGVRDDLVHVLTLLREGHVTAHVAARFPLEEAARAFRLAETRGTPGKAIIIPQAPKADADGAASVRI